jgi:hypothetical protein
MMEFIDISFRQRELSDDICYICFEDIKGLYWKCNKHQFHLDCLYIFIKKQQLCPTCKIPINHINIYFHGNERLPLIFPPNIPYHFTVILNLSYIFPLVIFFRAIYYVLFC